MYVVAPTGNIFNTLSWQFVKNLISHYPISMFLVLLLWNKMFCGDISVLML